MFFLREKTELGVIAERRKENSTSSLKDSFSLRVDEDDASLRKQESRHSVYEGVFLRNPDENLVLSLLSNIAVEQYNIYQSAMVDQDDIIALTRHVRSFSDALNNLRNTFRDGFIGMYLARCIVMCVRACV